MIANPYQQYQTTRVQSASTGELVVLLYDGAIRSLNRALLAIEEGRLDQASDDLVRGQEIVLELMAGLDFEQGGALAANLRDLYLYMYKTLVESNFRKDPHTISRVVGMLTEIRMAWRTVVHGAETAPTAPVMMGARAA